MTKSVWTALWNGNLIARSAAVRILDGKPYFPPESIQKEFFELSTRRTLCPWKGTAGWYHLEVDGLRKPDAAWCYESPKPAAHEIARYIAFSPGVIVEEKRSGTEPSQQTRYGSSRSRPVSSSPSSKYSSRRSRPGTGGKPAGFAAKLKEWIR